MNDRLRWWEDIPLGLALVAQSYVVGLWYYASISGATWWLDLVVAVGAGLALDLIVVTTVMGRRAGRSSGWSWATSFGAFACSSLIALDRYGWEWRSLLHVAFPLVVFLYSQHLATPQKATAKVPLETLPERLVPSEPPIMAGSEHTLEPLAFEHYVESLIKESGTGATNGQAPVGEALTDVAVIEAARYVCPHCGSALASKQAIGAAVKNGYCLVCKHERKN